MDCIFCAIAKGEMESFKVYEDRQFLAFLDIRPLTKGHSLVIPKNHYRWVDEFPAFGNYFEAAKKVGLALKSQLKANPVYYQTMGFGVPHAHIHVIPRYPDDGQGEVLDWKKTKRMDPEEMREIVSALFSTLMEDP